MTGNKENAAMNHYYVKTAKRLMGYMAGTYRLQFVCVLATVIINALANVTGPLFLMVLIDDFITPLLGQQHPDFTVLDRVMTRLTASYVVEVIYTYTYNRLMTNTGQGVQRRIGDKMFEHMQTLSTRYFDRHPHGELMSRHTNDIDTLRQMISQALPMVLPSFVTIITVSAVMIGISIPLFILATTMIVLMLFVSRTPAGWCGRYFVAQQLVIGKVTRYVEERLSGQKVIKVFNHEEETREESDELNDRLYGSVLHANKYANVIVPVITNTDNLQLVLTATAGGILSLSGLAGLTLGRIASYLQFIKSFNRPFAQMFQQPNSIIITLAGVEHISNTTDEGPETNQGDVILVNIRMDGSGKMIGVPERASLWAQKCPCENGTAAYTRLTDDVWFQDMDFGYEPGHAMLHDIGLYAKPGRKPAFVGATGTRKTIIASLINRFYDIQKGSITYDGIGIRHIKKGDLRRSLGIMLQDTHLFTGTIRENIRYRRLDATDGEICGAAKLADAGQLIEMLPEGYDTTLTRDGKEPSQGQRQLLAITRTATADPPVPILDEAASSIDIRTEAMVQRGMDKSMKGRTVFVITRRFSTIRNSDAIVVLDYGRIAERGDHEGLIRERGMYYQLHIGGLELGQKGHL